MNPIELINAKKAHIARLAAQSGAAGEVFMLDVMARWIKRPSGKGLHVLLAALRETGIQIKGSSFDAIEVPSSELIDFTDPVCVRRWLPDMIFIEIKTASQSRVRPDFTGFFFALTENEIVASDALGLRHRVALFNKKTGEVLMTSIPEIVARARSATWQVSVQL